MLSVGLDMDSACDLKYTADDSNNVTFPLQFNRIMALQQKGEELLDQAATNPYFHLKSFSTGGKIRTLICN